ncbi:MAG: pyridoxal phosphate-dependent aminotransferase [Negativicutes bacterium]|nr:pyridoxal phosphate-dependent aminotransferase [Negativicutes bacterium]
MKRLSQLTSGLIGQAMLAIMNKVGVMEAVGRRIYRFEVGDSDFAAYPHVIDATKEALDHGHTKYVSTTGITPFRQAICDYTEKSLGFRPDLDQVVVMPSNSVVDFVFRCVADRGDEVIFTDPGFPTYHAVASYLGLKEVRVPIREADGFRLDPDDLAARITDKTRLIIINSPHNPTGSVMTKEQLKQVAAIAREHDIYLLSDEMYAEIIYDVPHFSPGCEDACRERTIILNGFSKAHSMSGWRIGYAIGPTELITAMGLMFETVYSCLPPFVQYAGISALKTEPGLLDARRRQYRVLRDLMIARLNEIPGVTCNVPQGAMYVFPNITGTGLSSAQFADFVLEKAGVAVVPGSCFGSGGEGYVRLCYARDEAVIEEACAAMKQAFSK